MKKKAPKVYAPDPPKPLPADFKEVEPIRLELTHTEIDSTVMLKAWANFFLQLTNLTKEEREQFLKSVTMIHAIQWKVLK